MRPLSVLIAGGGSAGHVEPALAVADVLRARGHRVTILGTNEGLESRLVPARGYPLETVPKVPLPRRPGVALLRVPGRLRTALRQAGAVLTRTGADVVLGVGGYVSAPAYLAARRARVPIVVHEANPVPGLANRLGARLTHHVAITVPGTPLRHGVLTGLPLRPEIAHLDRAARRSGARLQLGLPADGPVLLVTGGSQGARSLNAAVTAAAADLLAAGVAVLHVTGVTHAAAVAEAVQGLDGPYVVLPYAEDMAACYAAADLVLCRSGAGTCAEVAAVGLPAVFVPLPIGNGEQARNARPAVEAGGALLVDDADLTAGWIREEILPLVLDRDRLGGMARSARRAQPGDAAVTVADLVELAARETGRRERRP